jgi:molybdopterin molybdotransferase
MRRVSVRDALTAMAGFPLRMAARERIAVEAADGRVLAADVHAAENVPPFTRSCVDGFAVIAADVARASEAAPVMLRVVGDVVMGKPAPDGLVRGSCMRIPTGGAMPAKADGVVMMEEAVDNGDVVEIRDGSDLEDHVTREGADVRAGDLLCEAGTIMSPAAIGMLATAGVDRVEVYRAPRVGVLITGDELVPLGAKLARGQIHDSNRATLCAAITALGCEAASYPRVADDRSAFDTAFAVALAENDAVVISGGSSVGERDYTPAVISAAGSPGVIVHGVRAKPGRPAVLAVIGDKPIIGLPGNPVSALVVFETLGRPTLLRMFGISADPLPWRALLSADIVVSTHLEHRIPVKITRDGNGLIATPLFGTSAHMHILGLADGLVVVPEGVGAFAAGSEVDVVPYTRRNR